MNRARPLSFLLPPLLLLVPVLLAPAAAATAPTTASGDFAFVSSDLTEPPQFVDDRAIIHADNTVAVTGTFVGTEVCATRVEQTWPPTPTGSGTFHCDGTFTGTVDGVAGTFAVRRQGTIDGFTARGSWVILGGTGDLAGLHGQGEFTQVGGAGTYSGQIHFDPAA